MTDNKHVFSPSLAGKIIVVALLVIVVAVVLTMKEKVVPPPEQNPVNEGTPSVNVPQQSRPSERVPVARGSPPTSTAQKNQEEASPPLAAAVEKKIPLLLDLGSNKCIPCKMMAPILEELKKEYAGTLQVELMDVWKDPGAGTPYKIRVIPTQIFFDSSGKEVYRHEGFMSKEDILSRWEKLGLNLEKETTP